MSTPEIEYKNKRQSHWDRVALEMKSWPGWGQYYHQRVEEIYQHLVTPGLRVLEIGCGRGDLLAALEPSEGTGVDFSGEMIRRAQSRHPQLTFIQADIHELELDQTFDVIILSDLVNDLWDLEQAFRKVAELCDRHTRIIINCYSRLWELPLAGTRALGLARPTLYQNWLTVEDLSNLLLLTDFQEIRHWSEILLPLQIPVLAGFCNRFLVKIWPFRYLALSNFIVARPFKADYANSEAPIVSVIVPARNEAGHIADIIERIPEMGKGTEIIFVEGHSRDDTYEVIKKAIAENPERQCKLFRQTGQGKGDAVRLGFDEAEGEMLMILDADMTVPPENLINFYEALISNKGELINGVRLVYPMEDQAMRYANLLGNKFFSVAFSWLLGQPIKDTLCGTKVLSKRDYETIASNRSYFGGLDPFGDFDLILGAARLNMKIVDLPIRYRERMYGETNIRRWRHGLLLFRMVFKAAWQLKFR